MAYYYGTESIYSLIKGQNVNQAMFNFVMVTIALTRPLRHLIANVLRAFGFMFKIHLLFWWYGSFMLTTLLAGCLSEIALMTLQCFLLAHFFFNLSPSKSLSYFTLGLLLVCLAFGNTVIPFNLSDTLDFHIKWGWSHWHIFQLFGWKSFLSIAVVAGFGGFWFRSEFAGMQEEFDKEMEEVSYHPINFRLFFYFVILILASLSKHSPYLMFALLIVIVFLHKKHYRSEEEGELHLRLPLLVAFFTYTLEIYASLQASWVTPMVEGLQGPALFASSFLLTGLNEYVLVHAVETVLRQASESDKFLSCLGIIAGGGLTFFANSVNIVAKKKLSPFFEFRAISPIRQILASFSIAVAVSGLVFLLSYAGL